MKKAIIAIVAIVLLIWVVSWFRTPKAVATAAARPWPGGMGTLNDVAARFPEIQANDAAKKFRALATALGTSQAVDDFVGRETARGELTIGEPPALRDLSAIRELLLNERVVWKRAEGIGEVGDADTSTLRGLQMTTARMLIASALGKARANDPAAWDDLHAVWNLARSLDAYPEMMLQTASFSMGRMINAVSWKMPLPAPAWLGELQQRDDVRQLLAAFQYQDASYWQDSAHTFPTKWLADAVEKDRGIAEKLFTETRCDVTTDMNTLGVDLSSVWRRAFRYRAEREGSANAL
ncbi:MAG TPA: hypothetical protein VM733_21350, partial [Thermoanaerobaculia bacterium]|nr:hypothetical protein [Thermoanaerobaculia bacterium]